MVLRDVYCVRYGNDLLSGICFKIHEKSVEGREQWNKFEATLTVKSQ